MSVEKPTSLSAETIELAKKILLDHCRDRIRIYVQEDVNKLRPQLERTDNLTHFFGRLEIITRDAKTQAAVAQQIKQESAVGSTFYDHINNLKMSNGGSIYDVLTGEFELPYKDRALQSEMMSDRKKFEALLIELGINDFDAFIADEFFHEYMKNYFRAARKLAAEGGDD